MGETLQHLPERLLPKNRMIHEGCIEWIETLCKFSYPSAEKVEWRIHR